HALPPLPGRSLLPGSLPTARRAGTAGHHARRDGRRSPARPGPTPGIGGAAPRLPCRVVSELHALLARPTDTGGLALTGEGPVCEKCGSHYPITDGLVSFLDQAGLTEVDKREQSSRDQEASWYDSMFEGYTNAIEVPTVVKRLGAPQGPVVDIGCGTGRI